MFGLPANDPVFVPNGPDPGTQGDESEADIDVQWSGAVAPAATIDFVISQSTETTSGVDLSAVFIVDQNLAPIMSESYGYCSRGCGLGTTGNQFYNALWQQASAEGITVSFRLETMGQQDVTTSTLHFTRAGAVWFASEWLCFDAVQRGGRRHGL